MVAGGSGVVSSRARANGRIVAPFFERFERDVFVSSAASRTTPSVAAVMWTRTKPKSGGWSPDVRTSLPSRDTVSTEKLVKVSVLPPVDSQLPPSALIQRARRKMGVATPFRSVVSNVLSRR